MILNHLVCVLFHLFHVFHNYLSQFSIYEHRYYDFIKFFLHRHSFCQSCPFIIGQKMFLAVAAQIQIKQFYSQPFYIMKSPSRQVVNRHIKTSMNILLRQDHPRKYSSNSSNFQRVICDTRDFICRELEVIGWRYKTSLPIIKPVSYNLVQFQEKKQITPPQFMRTSLNDIPTKSNASQVDTKILMDYMRRRPDIDKFTVEVSIQNIQYRLSDLGCLPFSQIIYLLKEMMIGYDVLVDIFGSFQPTDQMIAVCQTSHWRVWINEDYTKNNKPENSTTIAQKELIYKLIFIAEKHCTPTNLSKIFFSDLKQFTNSKECSFIKTLQKIKEFITINKIFQVNKVTIAGDKKVNDSIQIQIRKQFTNLAPSNSMTNAKLEKKTLPFTKPKFQTQGFFRFQCKSSTNLMDSGHNSSMILSPTNYPHKNMNISAMETGKSSSKSIFAQVSSSQSNLLFIPLRMIRNNYQKTNQANYRSKQPKNLKNSSYMEPSQKRSNFHQHIKSLSPQRIANKYPPNFNKSRLQLKALVNQKKSTSPQPKTILQQKKPPKTRKYSQQIVKVRSLEALISKKFAGSNIYMNDPEAKVAVNVIKPPHTNPTIENSGDYSTDKKLLSPNYSSPSTKQLKGSKQSYKDKFRRKEKYISLKMNDLGCKIRNNMSSCYETGNQKCQEKPNKNMAISYSFNNNNKNDDYSSESQKNDNKISNNWKKISGLFSDNASIKQLKNSVKFKTIEEELFQKTYLKDVKLELLEKIGRPVRHSIVDQQDNFDSTQAKNPFNSMQLIEQVFQDGRSHIQKQQEEEQIGARSIRKRNQTVQIVSCAKQEMSKAAQVNKKQCISEYCESEEVQSQNGFNFQTEKYVINPKGR